MIFLRYQTHGFLSMFNLLAEHLSQLVPPGPIVSLTTLLQAIQQMRMNICSSNQWANHGPHILYWLVWVLSKGRFRNRGCVSLEYQFGVCSASGSESGLFWGKAALSHWRKENGALVCCVGPVHALSLPAVHFLLQEKQTRFTVWAKCRRKNKCGNMVEQSC